MKRLAILLGLLVGVGSCSDPWMPEQTGPITVVRPLPAEHPDVTGQECSFCHEAASIHPGIGAETCAVCHGGNVPDPPPVNPTPQLDETHPGWQLVDCGFCHVKADAHEGRYEFTTCGACHGGNGAPPRPHPHYVSGCNDCHADGPLPWNCCSHHGLESSSPQGCLDCHR